MFREVIWQQKGFNSLNLICEGNVPWPSRLGMSRDITVDTSEMWGMWGTLCLLHCWRHVSMISHTQNLTKHLCKRRPTHANTHSDRGSRRSHAYRCIIVIVLFLQVERWHLTSQQCPAELPADLQFIRGSYLSHSLLYSFITLLLTAASAKLR